MKDVRYWEDVKQVPSSLKPSATLIGFIEENHINSIIDFGCGEGKILNELSTLGKNQLGIDLNSSSINIAKAKQIRNTEFICGNLSTCVLSRNFDLGILQAVLTVIPDLKSRVNLLINISKYIDFGIYINEFLQTPDQPKYFNYYKKGITETSEFGSFLVRENDEIKYCAHHFTPSELEIMLASVGLKVVSKQISKVTTRSGSIIDGIEIFALKDKA